MPSQSYRGSAEVVCPVDVCSVDCGSVVGCPVVDRVLTVVEVVVDDNKASKSVADKIF